MTKMDWISIKDRKPQTEETVIVLCETKNHHRYVTVADYIAYRTVLAEDHMDQDSDPDFDDYDEEKDISWAREGFYEYMTMADNNYYIADNVTHWMRLPAMPDQPT
jgi:hypothetical protein